MHDNKPDQQSDDEFDSSNLIGLRTALGQSALFGVATDPTEQADSRIHASMLRLESRGLVRRTSENEFGIWWQATSIA